MRHKLITILKDVNWEFFRDLKDKGYVAEEYTLNKSYNKKRLYYTNVGAFHQVKHEGKVHYSIATNSGWKYNKHSKIKEYGFSRIRIMYLLTDEGVKFVQDYIFMKKLEEGGK